MDKYKKALFEYWKVLGEAVMESIREWKVTKNTMQLMDEIILYQFYSMYYTLILRVRKGELFYLEE